MKRRSKRAFPAKRTFVWWKKEREAAQIHRGAGARTMGFIQWARPGSARYRAGVCQHSVRLPLRKGGEPEVVPRVMLALCPNGQRALFVTRKRLGMSENQMKMNIGGTDKWEFMKSSKRAA